MDDFPLIPDYDDLISPDELAEKLSIHKTTIMRMRFIEPRLPYIRLVSAKPSIMFSKAQVTWWLNQYQKASMIKFDLLRDQARIDLAKRRRKAGLKGPPSRKE